MTLITGHSLVKSNALPFVIENEKEVAASREAVNAIAERNAVLHLIETAKILRDSMSIVDQPSLHKRLCGDIQALNRFFPESK